MTECNHVHQELVKYRRRGYPYKKNYGPMWVCLECNAHVGCHRGTHKPLGTPADAQTRVARLNAHKAFDALWSNRKQRSALYRQLAEHFGMSEFHIGSANSEQCQEVIQWATARQFE